MHTPTKRLSIARFLLRVLSLFHLAQLSCPLSPHASVALCLGVCTERSPLFYIKSQISMAFTEVSEKLWGYSCAHPKTSVYSALPTARATIPDKSGTCVPWGVHRNIPTFLHKKSHFNGVYGGF